MENTDLLHINFFLQSKLLFLIFSVFLSGLYLYLRILSLNYKKIFYGI